MSAQTLPRTITAARQMTADLFTDLASNMGAVKVATLADRLDVGLHAMRGAIRDADPTTGACIVVWSRPVVARALVRLAQVQDDPTSRS